MDEMLEDEELMFNNEVISKLANESVSNIIGEKMYTEKDSKIWMNKIVESVLTSLQTLNKPFKYIVTVLLEQKNGAGLYASSDCRWDASTDGFCCVNWNNETTHAVITIFGLHIQ
mmetsp:Transcript_18050/g.16154  ORF Transcript_18050/g.16154 Transcript_18050/m.16154 type:complete len:115 (-) Transcript_18050:225-569(-)